MVGRKWSIVKELTLSVVTRMPSIRVIDAGTDSAVSAFLSRLPAEIRLERAFLYGSRARGDFRQDSDADLALVLTEGGNGWQLLWDLSGLAYDVFLETGILPALRKVNYLARTEVS